ncbi:Zinc finger, C2H2 type protein [Ceratobasidium theobromae]|uniref:Zinc finger, C2H2 type protein n=1 Tax=Ceratobasidium theobromae TaxID=1582974 RepID=A0A5N5QXC4_9AGAM|nr:Zinc finger, C2H2 type protein [Ceratobasidium theobromae]
MFTHAWTPRARTDDDWSDHHPSPVYEPSPVDAWLSPVCADDDMPFDAGLCSLVDDAASHSEQQSMLERWRTPFKALLRQPTDEVLIAGEWEERLVRRFQRKHKLQGKSLLEVRRNMAPIEFDPAFADSDTEDEDEGPFDPHALLDPPMRPIPAYLPPSPLPSLSPPPEPKQDVVKEEPVAVKQEAPDDPDVAKRSPDDPEPLTDLPSEGEYVPSDDEEDDADPTYGAPKTRPSHSAHSRTSSTADKPPRAGPGRRRRPVDDTAPSQCTYENPLNGQRCQQIFARLPEMKRHIDHFHHEQEARAVLDGRLPRDRAKLLGDNWDGTLGKPTCEGCGTEFSRRDAVKRHQNEVKARFDNGRCVWCPGTQGRKGSAKRVAAAKLAGAALPKKQRRK